MGIQSNFAHVEDQELITNYDLVSAAHELLGGIPLDAASSRLANDYVEAETYFTPTDDALNDQIWEGSVYCFPPAGTYFWEKANERWKKTRGSSPTLSSASKVWFSKMYKEWIAGHMRQGLFFVNNPDIIRYDQRIFDFPVCILKTAPTLVKSNSKGISKHTTCTSLLVYMPPMDNPASAIEIFRQIYEVKGRVLC